MWRWPHFVINWILENLQNRSVRLDFQLASVSRFHVQAQAVQPENNVKGKSGVDKDSDSKDESARLLANSVNFFFCPLYITKEFTLKQEWSKSNFSLKYQDEGSLVIKERGEKNKGNNKLRYTISGNQWVKLFFKLETCLNCSDWFK